MAQITVQDWAEVEITQEMIDATPEYQGKLGERVGIFVDRIVEVPDNPIE